MSNTLVQACILRVMVLGDLNQGLRIPRRRFLECAG